MLPSASDQKLPWAVWSTKCSNPCSTQWEMCFFLKSNLLAFSTHPGYRHSETHKARDYTRSRCTQPTFQPSPIPAPDKTTPLWVGEKRGNSTWRLYHKPSRTNCHFGKYLLLHTRQGRHLYSRNKSPCTILASTWEKTRWWCRSLMDVLNNFSHVLSAWRTCHLIHQDRCPFLPVTTY